MGTVHPTILLESLLEGVSYQSSTDVHGITISSVTADSRQVTPGSLFIALSGMTVDGHLFIKDAQNRGCAAVVVERGRGGKLKGLTVIEVDDTRKALGHVAAAFYGHPASKLCLIGITGTNGKTTTSYLLEAIVRSAGGNPGVFGTVNYRIGSRIWPALLTTPEPLVLQRLLKDMVDAGATHVIMEVSSHALAQERLVGLLFDVALFTNLSRDHLDFHSNMEEYYNSKKKLFTEHLKKDGRALVVIGLVAPDWGSKLVADLNDFLNLEARQGKQSVITCGLQQGLVQAEQYSQNLQGIKARLLTPAGTFEVRSGLVGEFNIRNIVAAAAAGWSLGIDPDAIASGISGLAGVSGRLERVPAKAGVQVFVDYAHTPDALENVLSTLKDLGPTRLIVVFGCGGERDRGKRPLMAEVAGRLADLILVTTDNPRRESPATILADIEEGLIRMALPRMRAEALFREGCRGYDVIPDRREAIGLAVRLAQAGDVVLISGKGHENYQITSQGRHFFDDRLEVLRKVASITC